MWDFWSTTWHLTQVLPCPFFSSPVCTYIYISTPYSVLVQLTWVLYNLSNWQHRQTWRPSYTHTHTTIKTHYAHNLTYNSYTWSSHVCDEVSCTWTHATSIHTPPMINYSFICRSQAYYETISPECTRIPTSLYCQAVTPTSPIIQLPTVYWWYCQLNNYMQHINAFKATVAQIVKKHESLWNTNVRFSIHKSGHRTPTTARWIQYTYCHSICEAHFNISASVYA